MITFFLWFFLLVAVFIACSCLVLSYKAEKSRRIAERESKEAKERESLAIEAYEKIKNAPKVVLEKAKATAARIVEDAQSKSNQILEDTNSKFVQIQEKTKKLEALADALQNRIDGYADKYLIPIESVMDKLASELANTQPANELKLVKNQLKKSIKMMGLGDTINDEADPEKAARRLALDAFLSKAESVIEKIKGGNFGIQKQKIIDSFTISNECLSVFEIKIDK